MKSTQPQHATLGRASSVKHRAQVNVRSPFGVGASRSVVKLPTRVINTACRALRDLEQCQQYDVLELKTATGTVEHLQVMEGWNPANRSAVILRKGQLLLLAAAAGQDSGSYQLAALGSYPAADNLAVRSFPELGGVLDSLHNHDAGSAPLAITSVEVADSLAHLQQQVEEQPGFWCDGTAPGDPIKTELQQAMFTAGELAAFLAGQRGIALVQLWNGWDASKGQPIYNPLVIHMLEQALAAPGVGHCSSVAPGGVGLTAIVYADREPFASWAAHLASFGCQANAVAGSAYYKLLIGQLLGYKLAHVLGYVAASGEPASAQLQQQVAQDIKRLSKVKAKLPWSASDTNIRKPKPASSTEAKGAAAAHSPSGAGFSKKGGFSKPAARR